MLNFWIKKINESFKSKEFSCEELTKNYLENISKKDWDIWAYLEVFEKKSLENAKKIDEKWNFENILTWIPYSLKDLICKTDTKTTAWSKILENFISPFDSTVSQKLSEWVFLWKVNLDEFAMGSSNENSAFKTTKNPHNLNKVPWGSSWASAASVASNQAVFSIWTDTGGSIRQPASFCWVVGLKPTYWRVSRYWVISYASSLDTIWPLTKTVEDSAIILWEIAWKDEKDSTSSDLKVENYLEWIEKDLKWKKIAILENFFELDWISPEVKENFENTIKLLEKLWATITKIKIEEIKHCIPVYYLIAKAEASSNLSRYDWIRFWKQESWKDLSEIYINSRSLWFWDEVKRSIMLWTYTLSSWFYDAYFQKAAKVRRIIKEWIDKVFEDFDAILAPTTPTEAFDIWEMIKDPAQMYLQDIFTVPFSLSWNPVLSIPSWKSKSWMPLWVQIIWKDFDEKKILNIWNILEKEIWFKNI